MSRLDVQSLSVECGSFRLREVSLCCPDGKCLALLGPSGAGKTTLVEAVVGLRRPSTGRVLIDGREVTGEPPERRGVSFLPQDLALFPHLSVRDNVLFPTRVRPKAPDSVPRMHDLAGRLGIVHVLSRRNVRSLSGGEAQRVALARALIVPPKILFLDECFASLDTPLRRRLVGELHALQRELTLTMMVVTHDQEEACILADEIAVLDEGRVLQIASPTRLYAYPCDARVARFLGMENIFDVMYVESREGRRFCSLGSVVLEIPNGGRPPSEIAFFAQDVELTNLKDGAQPNILNGRVLEVLCMGQRTLLRVCLEGMSTSALQIVSSIQSNEACRCEVGHTIRLYIPKERIRCLPRSS